jgi:hypothetical protein
MGDHFSGLPDSRKRVIAALDGYSLVPWQAYRDALLDRVTDQDITFYWAASAYLPKLPKRKGGRPRAQKLGDLLVFSTAESMRHCDGGKIKPVKAALEELKALPKYRGVSRAELGRMYERGRTAERRRTKKPPGGEPSGWTDWTARC